MKTIRDMDAVRSLIRSDLAITEVELGLVDNYVEVESATGEEFDELYMLMVHERNYSSGETLSSATSHSAIPATDEDHKTLVAIQNYELAYDA